MLALFSPAWPLQPCCSTRTDGHCRNWHEKAGPVNEDGRAGCRSTSKQANGPSSSPERCRASSNARLCCSRQAPTRIPGCSVLYTIMTLQLASRYSCIKKTRQTGKGTGVFQPERVDILSHHLLSSLESSRFRYQHWLGQLAGESAWEGRFVSRRRRVGAGAPCCGVVSGSSQCYRQRYLEARASAHSPLMKNTTTAA